MVSFLEIPIPGNITSVIHHGRPEPAERGVTHLGDHSRHTSPVITLGNVQRDQKAHYLHPAACRLQIASFW